ncbi:unnamed protein product [Polarella glacialis]|uniref:MIT domain-containing protein n=1 Tax=Polarella glacialis TaxID=89957 RepID=A0A813KMB3_POLGL|nr:unnamed protein product [Polarella glacialis]
MPNASLDEDDRVLCAAFAELAAEASQIERCAMDLDRGGDPEQALVCYQQVAERLAKAAAACPEGNPDRAVLARHAGQVLGRVVYLESLGGSPATAPPEVHIGFERLSDGQTHGPLRHEDADGFHVVQRTNSVEEDATERSKPSWRKQAASAAAVGGTAGLLVLHAPIVAVAMAAGAAYATTRKDSAGDAARSMGDMGLQAAKHTRSVAEEYKVPERVDHAMSGVRSLDERYRVSERTQAAASSSAGTLKEINRKHQVTSKIGSGVVTATSGLIGVTSTAVGWVSRTMASRR